MIQFSNAVEKLVDLGYKLIVPKTVKMKDDWCVLRKSKTQVQFLYPLNDGEVMEFILKDANDVDNNPRIADQNRKIVKTIKQVVRNTH